MRPTQVCASNVDSRGVRVVTESHWRLLDVLVRPAWVSACTSSEACPVGRPKRSEARRARAMPIVTPVSEKRSDFGRRCSIALKARGRLQSRPTKCGATPEQGKCLDWPGDALERSLAFRARHRQHQSVPPAVPFHHHRAPHLVGLRRQTDGAGFTLFFKHFRGSGRARWGPVNTSHRYPRLLSDAGQKHRDLRRVR